MSGSLLADVSAQADRLAAALKVDPHYAGLVDEWKLLNVFIGANDVCACDQTTLQGWEVRGALGGPGAPSAHD